MFQLKKLLVDYNNYKESVQVKLKKKSYLLTVFIEKLYLLSNQL